jgi:uncharacterized FlaG/YvyC family protein
MASLKCKKNAQMAIVPQKIAEEKLSNMLEEIRDIIQEENTKVRFYLSFYSRARPLKSSIVA